MLTVKYKRSMDSKNENMVRNEKAEFAVKILLEYANENGINGRDTTDLSPLEQWLILRLYNVSNCGGAIPYDSLSDSFKKSIDSIEDNLNR